MGKEGIFQDRASSGPGFFSTIAASLHPMRYISLSSRSYRDVLFYFLSIVLFAVLLATVLWLPKLMNLQNTLEKQFDGVSRFQVTTEFATTAPLMVPKTRPLVVVDTTGERTSLGSEFLLVTDKIMIYRTRDGTVKRPIQEFLSLGNKKELSKLLFSLAVLVLPGLLIFIYLMLLIKYALIAVVATILAFIIVKLTRSSQSFHRIAKVSVYAVTLPVLLDVLAFPLGVQQYLLPISVAGIVMVNMVTLGLYALLFILGTVLSGETEVRLFPRI